MFVAFNEALKEINLHGPTIANALDFMKQWFGGRQD